MIELLLASGNAHKTSELQEQSLGSQVLVSAAPEKIEVIEDGESFSENSLKKASAYFEKYKRPVLSDDSGLLVDFLPGQLGLHTARFGGDGLTDRERSLLLLEKLGGASGEDRKAHFICVLCCYFSPEEIFFFEGRLKGIISNTYEGSLGFGYDPVFIPTNGESNETLAMQPEFKKLNSHRAKAFSSLLKFLRERDCQKGPF